MAFNAATEWDVRTGGSNSNGGGFQVGSTGTDRSIQDGPYTTFTDLVINHTTNTKITSAAYPFSATDVGNIINITSGVGFTVQRVQITAVVGVTATCDKAVGVIDSTGGNGKLGGGLLTIATAVGLLVVGNTIHIQSGTYTLTASISIVANGAAAIASKIKFVGYNATHGDNGTKPLITTATNSTPLFLGPAVSNYVGPYILQNLSLSNTAATRAAGIGEPGGGGARTTYWIVDNCIFDGFTAAIGDSSTNYRLNLVLTWSEIKNCTVNGIAARAGVWIQDSFLHDNTGTILWTPNGFFNLIIINSIIVDGTGIGISTPASTSGPNNVYIIACTIANHASHGISNANTLSAWMLENTILYGNGGWGAINSATIPFTILKNLAYGTNTSGNLSGFTASAADVTLVADPFNANYSLNSTAGGGAACKNAGCQWV